MGEFLKVMKQAHESRLLCVIKSQNLQNPMIKNLRTMKNKLWKPLKRSLSTCNSSPAISQFEPTFENVSVLLGSGQFEAAVSPFCNQTYARLFQECARRGRIDVGRALHRQMLRRQPTTEVDMYTGNHLLNMYAKCGELGRARELLDEMPQRNFVTWTSLVSGYAQHAKVDECFSMFCEMVSHCRPNDFAFTSVLSTCGGFRGQQVHALVLKIGFCSWVYVANALISMYCRNAYNEEALKIFDGMEIRNIVTWNAMIAGFQERGECFKAIEYFIEMCRDGIHLDRVTLVSLVSSFRGSEDEKVSGLKCCFQLHCVAIKTWFISDVSVVTALLNAYSCLGGEVDDCYQLFTETNGSRDIILWTGIMTAFAEKDPEEALKLLNRLHREGLSPDCYTFSTLLKACGRFVTDRQAMAVYCQAIKAGCANVIVLQNALIHAFARCGSVSLAREVFDGMSKRDVVSWNSILKAYALQGKGNEALDLFKQMDIVPDATTFTTILSACSHSGMVEEGTEIFNTMFEKHGVGPQLDHYATMVDILGRAGRLNEAEKVIQGMSMEPDIVVWSAFVGACRKHGETQLAEFGVSKLRELDPDNSLGYVLMSNLYCSSGSYNEARLIRKNMEGLGIKKETGLSWTEIGNQVHEFASGGREHPLGDTIIANTKELVKKLKIMGYVPETSFALHDVEEESKEEELYYHGEKLALVFALMNGDDVSSGCIKITKNIRICPDCHSFMKLASELVQKEIVVRDSNRFHSFKNGFCSCNDYW